MTVLASLGDIQQKEVTNALLVLAEDWRNRDPHKRPERLPDELTLVARVEAGLPLVPPEPRQDDFSSEILSRLSTVPPELFVSLGLDPANFEVERLQTEFD